MCQDCGCEAATHLISQRVLGRNQLKGAQLRSLLNPQLNPHLSPHLSSLGPSPLEESKPSSRKIEMGKAIVQKNTEKAQLNRQWFQEHRMPVINMMSAPGSGKTYLLEKTVEAFAGRLNFAILAGDQEMSYDADRLRKVGAQVKQINTLSSCHLNAEHIEAERDGFISADTQLLVIENVGNLVCPAAFDLGESHKVALLSTTEGEDKPSKYPLLFHEADLIVVTKMDLVPYLEWSQAVCQQHIRNVNSKAPVLYLSAKTGDGMAAWFQYLDNLCLAAPAS